MANTGNFKRAAIPLIDDALAARTTEEAVYHGLRVVWGALVFFILDIDFKLQKKLIFYLL